MAKRNSNNRKLNFQQGLPLRKKEEPSISRSLGSPMKPRPLFNKEADKIVRAAKQEALRPQEEYMPIKLRGNKEKKVSEVQQTTTPSNRDTSSKAQTTLSTSMTTSPNEYTTSTQPTTTSNMSRKQNSYRGGARSNGSNRSNYGRDNAVERPSGITYTTNEFTASYKDSSGQFLPDTSISSPVPFSLDVYNTTHLNQSELNSIANGGENIAKLDLNYSNFFVPVTYAYGRTSTSITAGSSDTYTVPFGDIFSKMSLDIYKDARSNIYSSWTQQNLCAALGLTCQALEYLVCLDSILAYQPKFKTPFDVNRNLIVFQSYFTSGALLSARLNLLRAIKGTWFPPKFAELIRWFYQNYRKGTGSQCAAYRYLPDQNFTINNGALSSTLIPAMNTLAASIDTSVTSQQIWAQLAKVYPEGIIKDIPGAHNDTVYDGTHFEIFNNEVCLYYDANNSGRLSGYPITLSSTSDVPYYMDQDPNSSNGFAFLMSNTLSSTDGTTNAINTAATNAPYYTGLRLPEAFVLSGSNFPTLGCNKWSFYPVTGNMNTRIYSISQAYNSTDAHNVLLYPTNGGTAFTTTYPISKIPAGFQRVYFDNAVATNTMSKFVMNHLFGLPA